MSVAPTTKPAAPSSVGTSSAAAIDRLLAAGISCGQPFSASVKWNTTGGAVEFRAGASQRTRPAASRHMIANPPRSEPYSEAAPVTPRPAPVQHVTLRPARPVPTSTPLPVQSAPIPAPRPAARPPPYPACSSETMTTLRLLCRVKWFGSLTNTGCAAPIEPGYPDVVITDAALQAGGVFYPKFRNGTTLVMVTFTLDDSLARAAVPMLWASVVSMP